MEIGSSLFLFSVILTYISGSLYSLNKDLSLFWPGPIHEPDLPGALDSAEKDQITMILAVGGWFRFTGYRLSRQNRYKSLAYSRMMVFLFSYLFSFVFGVFVMLQYNSRDWPPACPNSIHCSIPQLIDNRPQYPSLLPNWASGR